MDSPVASMDRPSGPVRLGERIATIDVLRGVALLGILVMNIPTFALPAAAMFNPSVAGGFEGANRAVWLLSHVLFEFKMMSIFSMLFGAGIILMDQRARARSTSNTGLHYARMGILLWFGIFHAYFIWFGDILVPYAVLGMVLYLVRRLDPRWLLALAGGCLLVGSGTVTLLGVLMDAMRDAATSDPNGEMAEAWREMQKGIESTPALLEEERAATLGGYWTQFEQRAGIALSMQLFMMPFLFIWRIAATVLIGMALCKMDVFSGARGRRANVLLMAVGYGIGGPLVAISASLRLNAEHDIVRFFLIDGHFNNVGSLFVALGHVGLLLSVCRVLGVQTGPMRWLADVGRMAFTNYLSQSLICAALFYGWGAGLFGQLDRLQLIWVVLVIWAVQLVWSRLWLARYRFGPMEWAWRSLSYGRRQPLRRAPVPEDAGARIDPG